MTLAIAAEFPWGEHRRILDSLPFRSTTIDGAIILAADTRWSYDDGSVKNDGRKLWVLGEHLGILLAGDVWAAEEGIRRLRTAGRTVKFTSANEVVALAAKTFADTYSAHHRARPNPGPVHYLLGFVDSLGRTALARLSSDGGFNPIWLRGVNAIGIKAACDAVAQNLNVATESEGFQNDDPTTWALRVVGAIDSVIQDGTQPTVGGAVQWVLGTKRGWEQIGTSALDPDTDFLVDSNWRDTSARLEDLVSIGSFEDKWLAACETTELVVATIPD